MKKNDWVKLVTAVKGDFARVGQGKSEIQRNLEKWVYFANRYARIADICGELHANITDNIPNADFTVPKKNTKRNLKKYTDRLSELGERAANMFQDCLKIELLTPILLESFVNLIIFVLCKEEIKENERHFSTFIRQDIDSKVLDLYYKCNFFSSRVDASLPDYIGFKKIMDRRNNLIHGNVDPRSDTIEEVFFDGDIPLYKEPGDHLFSFLKYEEEFHDPHGVVDGYIAAHNFIAYILNLLEERARDDMMNIMNSRELGYDYNRKRMGVLFGDFNMVAFLEGQKFDDELDVEWS